jgi:hypothetical protein
MDDLRPPRHLGAGAGAREVDFKTPTLVKSTHLTDEEAKCPSDEGVCGLSLI